jgi:biopolymer transport protein ExbB/TolQ
MAHSIPEIWAQMGWLARGVVIMLMAMSVYSVSIAVDRLLVFRKARRQSLGFAGVASRLWEQNRMHDVVIGAQSFRRSHLARVVSAGLTEYERKVGSFGLPRDVVLDATKRAADRATAVMTAELRRGTSSLATIGATAPFVGLFGTVIGIVRAFAEIAKAGTGGIQVVAGGVSEALVTTAIGLVVALPAVWLYNFLSQRVEQLQVEMSNSSTELVDRLLELEPEPERARAVAFLGATRPLGA